jgi:hypothetical protein
MIYDLKRYKTNIDVLYFKNKILKNEKKIIQKYPAKSWDLTEDFDGATGLGYNSLTARSPHFNVLNWWGVSSLKKEIKKSYFDITKNKKQPLYVQCWANVMRNGEVIKYHRHRNYDASVKYGSISGNLFISCDVQTNTHYESFSIPNEPGVMTLFPSFVGHRTDKYVGNEERISIAFDIKTKEDWYEDVYDGAKNHWIKI